MGNRYQAQWEREPLGRLLHILGTTERLGTRYLLQPLVGAFDQDALAKLQAMRKLGADVYAGDVINAVAPMNPKAGILEKILRGAGSVVAGAVVDPLSYVGLFGPTAKGVKALAKGTAAASRVAAAEKGEWALARMGGRAITPKVANVAAAKAAAYAMSGHATEKTLAPIVRHVPLLEHVGLPKVASFVDTFSRKISQNLGFNIGVDPWLFQHTNELVSKVIGQGKIRGSRIVDIEEGALQNYSLRFAEHLNRDPQEVYKGLKGALQEATDMHPEVRLAWNAEKSLHELDEFERAHQAVVNNFGLPPTFGGPSSPMDTELTFAVRDMVRTRKNLNAEVLKQEEERLGHSLAEHTHPDQAHSPRMPSQEALEYVKRKQTEELANTWIGGIKRGKRPYTSTPAEHTVHEIARTLRFVDPNTVRRLSEAGFLEPFSVRAVRKGGHFLVVPPSSSRGRVLNINPRKILEKNSGQYASKTIRQLVDVMSQVKILSDDRLAINHWGTLIPSLSTSDANELIRSVGLKFRGVEIPPGAVKNFFEVDPTVIDVRRGMAADRVLLSKEWFDAIKARGNKPGETRLVHPVGTEGLDKSVWKAADVPELEGWLVHKDAAEFLNRMHNADRNLPTFMRPFLTVLSHSNQIFKAWSLGIFPAYNTRNFVGEMWNLYLSTNDIKRLTPNLTKSSLLWDAFSKGNGDRWTLRGVVNPATGKDWTATEIVHGVQKFNGWNSGWIGAERPETLASQVRRMLKGQSDDPKLDLLRLAKHRRRKMGVGYIGPDPPSKARRVLLWLEGENKYTEKGFKIANYVSNRVRTAHMLERLQEGAPLEDAVRTMKHNFFDYHQLTPIERQYMREVFPFYAWSRKNIPYQFEMMIRKPDRVARFGSFAQGWQGETPDEESLMSRWMSNSFPIRIRKRKDGRYEYFVLRNWLPLADINEIFHGWQWMSQNMAPLPRSAAEQLFNINWFTDRKLDYMDSLARGEKAYIGTGKGLPKQLLGVSSKGVPIPSRLMHVIKSTRLTSTLHQVIDDPQELGIWTQAGKVLWGRTYPLDVGRSRYDLIEELEKLHTAYKRSARSAVRSGHPEDVLGHQKTYIKKREKVLKQRGIQ